MDNKKKNVVLIAAGGGNDVFSAIAYAKCVLPQYMPDNIAIISLLGLTPFHTNVHVDIPEQCIITPEDTMSRYIVCNPPKKIRCMERLVPLIINNITPSNSQKLTKYACLSTKYSAVIQTTTLITQLESWDMKYDNTSIVVVDFGGDILTDGNQPSIISPELDAFSLALVRNLKDYGYESKLSVCFPGVDGELPPDYLTHICNTLATETIPIDSNAWKITLNDIYHHIKDERPVNTIPNMLKVLDNPECDMIDIKKTWVIGTIKLESNFNILINPKLQTYIYMFDIPNWNPFVNLFNSENYNLVSVLDGILEIYKHQDCNNGRVMQLSDLYLQYLRMDINGKWTNKDLNTKSNTVMVIDVLPKCIGVGDALLAHEEIETMNYMLYTSIR